MKYLIHGGVRIDVPMFGARNRDGAWFYTDSWAEAFWFENEEEAKAAANYGFPESSNPSVRAYSDGVTFFYRHVNIQEYHQPDAETPEECRRRIAQALADAEEALAGEGFVYDVRKIHDKPPVAAMTLWGPAKYHGGARANVATKEVPSDATTGTRARLFAAEEGLRRMKASGRGG